MTTATLPVTQPTTTTATNTRLARILVADDQPDILEALRLLLKGEDYDVETALSPAGVLLGAADRDFDAALIDLNYARDTTSGDEGLDLLARIRGVGPDAARVGHDGVGQCRRRGRSDAARGVRLRREAVETMSGSC